MNVISLPHADVGTYVVYKDTVQVIVKVSLNDRVQLLNPLGGNTKVTVLRANVIGTNYKPMTLMSYNAAFYLVSRVGTIISLKTGRVMQWVEDHGHRVAIMNLFNDDGVLNT
jgi:hypothetical protein